MANDSNGTNIENFSLSIDDCIVIGNVIIMDKSCWVWVSDAQDQSFASLHVSCQSKFESLPLVSTLITDGEISSDATRFAQRLAKKLNIQAFVSWNLKIENVEAVEAKVFDILKPYFKP